jgi:hypothetical protein
MARRPRGAVWTDELLISGRSVRVYMLGSGRRLVDPDDMAALCDAWIASRSPPSADAARLSRWLEGVGDA